MMRGVSTEALGELREKVAHTRVLADAAAMGEDLFSVATVLREEPALRRVLTDASVDGAAKAGLATSIFGGKLRPDTLAILTDAVQRRWTAGSDLTVAFGELAVDAVVRSAGAHGQQLSDQLFAVRELIQGDTVLRSTLSDPGRTPADRSALLGRLLEGKVLDQTLSLVHHAVLVSVGSVDTALAAYQKLAAQVLGETTAVVTTARPLSGADQDRLVRALGQQYATTVHLHVVVDPSLVGGLRVEIGDDVIDGSVSGRIDEARRRLVG